ncbi:MAG: hypothetical protein R3C56_15865 [Pirellulaceae bacterium]
MLDDAAVRLNSDSPGVPVLLLVWIAALWLSILIHELGHAFVMRFYGIRSRIVLLSFRRLGDIRFVWRLGWSPAGTHWTGRANRDLAGGTRCPPGALVVWLIGLQVGVHGVEWLDR